MRHAMPMSRLARIPLELAAEPFRGADAVAAGLLTPRQLDANCWRRVFQGVYVLDSQPDTLDLRARAARLLLPGGAAVSGRSAAYLLGVDVRARTEPLEVTVPRDSTISGRPGLAVRRAMLPEDDVIEIFGVPTTGPLRTAFDLGRRPGEIDAVTALDAFTHSRVVDLDALRRYVAGHRCWRGVRVIGDRLALVEPATESPMETRLRLLLIRAGLPRPVVQLAVYDADGEFLGRPDLSYPEARLAIEYDGRYHAEVAAFVADRQRLNRLSRAGWRVLHYTAEDVYRRPGTVAAQVRALLAQPAQSPILTKPTLFRAG